MEQPLGIVAQRLADAPGEHLLAALFDRDMQLIEVRLYGGGCRFRAPAQLRELVWNALRRDAQRLLLAHNHPSGIPRPSAADVELTRLVERTFSAIGIGLEDHLIFAGESVFSFREAGLL